MAVEMRRHIRVRVVAEAQQLHAVQQMLVNHLLRQLFVQFPFVVGVYADRSQPVKRGHNQVIRTADDNRRQLMQAQRANCFSSFCAAGRYMLKIIAEPMPNSARFSIPSTSPKRPFTPRYSCDR